MSRSHLLALPGLLLLGGCCWLFQGQAPATSGDATEAEPVEVDPWASMPEPGPAPQWSVPGATSFTLSNGIPVTFVQTGKVPLVGVRLNIYTGSATDPAGQSGLADFTADLLNEGTSTRDALTLSDDLQTLASSIGFGAQLDYSYASVQALEDKLDETLAIFAEMLSDSTFPQGDIDRVRGDRINRLITGRDQIQTVGYEAFAKLLYGDVYLGRQSEGTEASISALTRDDLVSFYGSAWRPSNAGLVVVGRMDVAEITALLEKHLGGWQGAEGSEPPAQADVAVAPATGVTIYWIDRPGASQSYISLGNVAPAWDPDHSTARILSNNVLGGYFTARLNMNLREDKGYTYGARSSISSQGAGGMWRASSSVKAATTALALTEFMDEITGILGEQPISDEEFAASSSRAIQQVPGSYESLFGVLGQFGYADAVRRPDGWLPAYAERVDAVSKDIAQAEFASIVDPSNLVIVIVGDWNHLIEIQASTADGRDREITALVGEEVAALGLGPIVMLDEDGNPVPDQEKSE